MRQLFLFMMKINRSQNFEIKSQKKIYFYILCIFLELSVNSVFSQNNQLYKKYYSTLKFQISLENTKDSIIKNSLKDTIKISQQLDSTNKLIAFFIPKIDSIDKLILHYKFNAVKAEANNDYFLSITYLRLAASCMTDDIQFPLINETYFRIASCFAHEKLKDSCLVYLNKSLNLNDDLLKPLFDKEFMSILSKKEIVDLIKKSNNNFIFKNPKIDIETALYFRQLYYNDQFIRNLYSLSDTKLIKDSIENKKRKIDSTNFIFLKNYIEKNGWPDIEKLSESAEDCAFTILLHLNGNIQKKYLPLVVESYKKYNNETNYNKLHFLIDETLVNIGVKPIYGTHSYIENGKIYSSTFIPEPIEIINKISINN